MTRRRALLAALTLPVLLGAGACSEDESLSKDEFIEQGDEICQRADDRTEDIEEPDDLESIGAYADEVAPIFEEAGDDFEALEAPEDGQEVQDAFVDLVREGQDTLVQLRAAVEDDDQERVQELGQDLSDLGEGVNDQLRDYGFEQCGEDDG